MHRALLLITLVAACGAKASPPIENRTVVTGGPSVEVHAEVAGGGHVLVIENRTDQPLRLGREIVVEMDTDGAWNAVEAGSLYLRDHCDVPGAGLYEPPACVEIAPRATFRAEPWTDSIGDSQCACEECGPAGAGSYRFAVSACDGSARYATEPFDVSRR